jgi:hypothetical protein
VEINPYFFFIFLMRKPAQHKFFLASAASISMTRALCGRRIKPAGLATQNSSVGNGKPAGYEKRLCLRWHYFALQCA